MPFTELTPGPDHWPPNGSPFKTRAWLLKQMVVSRPARASSSSTKLNLKEALLQLVLRLMAEYVLAPGGTGKLVLPPHPPHTAWYTKPRLSKRLVPPSTCSPLPPVMD